MSGYPERIWRLTKSTLPFGLTAKRMDSDQAGSMDRRPDFLVVGVTKAGTSTLWTHLREHPEIYVPDEKEIGFFSNNFFRGREWYSGHFEAAKPGQSAGEATPSYLYDPKACDRIAQYLPDVRLIFLLRNPVERAYSHYWMKRKKAQEIRSFEECVDQEISARRKGGEPRGFPYLGIGLYSGHLKRFHQRFSRENILVLLFEEFIASQRNVLQDVYRFVGVDPTYVPPDLGVVANPMTRGTGVVGSEAVLRAVYAVRLVSKALGLIPPLRSFYQRTSSRLKFLHRRWNVVEGSVPPMDAGVRQKLADFYREDIAALERMLGRNLDLWKAD